jgi:hypothetical protein
LLLAGAFVLSILFVVLALLLNAASVTALTANSAGDPTGAVQGPTFGADSRLGTASLLAVVNSGPGSSYATRHGELWRAVDDWSDLTTRLSTTRGGSTRLRLADTTNGSRIVQRNVERNLTSAVWQDNWTVASGVTRVRDYSLTLSRTGLVDPAETASARDLVNASTFRVAVETGTSGDRWRVFAYRDGASDVVVVVETPSNTLSSTCRAAAGSDNTVSVDLTGATVGGDDCPALDFVSSLGDLFRIEYEMGSSATGSYTADVDVDRSSIDGPRYGETGSETHPYVAEIIYDATVRVDVVRPKFTYETSVTVTEGASDD